jgi:hypothetical protein
MGRRHPGPARCRPGHRPVAGSKFLKQRTSSYRYLPGERGRFRECSSLVSRNVCGRENMDGRLRPSVSRVHGLPPTR